MERFIYGEFAAHRFLESTSQGAPPETMFSYVLKVPVLDPQRLGETVARNRGMLVQAFDNPEEALAWLSADPHRPPP